MTQHDDVWYDGFWWRLVANSYRDMSCYLMRTCPDGRQYGCRVSLQELKHSQQRAKAPAGLSSVYHVAEGL